MADAGATLAEHPPLPPPRLAATRVQRALWIIAGSIALALGVIGIYVSGLPTTPFLLLAAYCYSRGSRRLYYWIYGHRVFGPILLAWEQERSLSLRTKKVGILTAWGGILLSITLLHLTAPAHMFPLLFLLLVLTACGVTTFLATRRTTLPRALKDHPEPERVAQAISRRLGHGILAGGCGFALVLFYALETSRFHAGWLGAVVAMFLVAALLVARGTVPGARDQKSPPALED